MARAQVNALRTSVRCAGLRPANRSPQSPRLGSGDFTKVKALWAETRGLGPSLRSQLRRVGVAPVRRDPARLLYSTIGALYSHPKPELSTLLKTGSFYFAPTWFWPRPWFRPTWFCRNLLLAATLVVAKTIIWFRIRPLREFVMLKCDLACCHSVHDLLASLTPYATFSDKPYS